MAQDRLAGGEVGEERRDDRVGDERLGLAAERLLKLLREPALM